MDTIKRGWITLWHGKQPSCLRIAWGLIQVLVAINIIHFLIFCVLGMTP